MKQGFISTIRICILFDMKHFYDMKYSKNCILLAKIFDVHIFVRLLAKTCAHLCAFLKNFDVRIFVRLLAKVCAHLSSELLVTLLTGLQKTTSIVSILVSITNFFNIFFGLPNLTQYIHTYQIRNHIPLATVIDGIVKHK